MKLIVVAIPVFPDDCPNPHDHSRLPPLRNDNFSETSQNVPPNIPSEAQVKTFFVL